jgi:hypothetical protein
MSAEYSPTGPETPVNSTDAPVCARCGETECEYFTTPEEMEEEDEIEAEYEADLIEEMEQLAIYEEEGFNAEILEATGEYVMVPGRYGYIYRITLKGFGLVYIGQTRLSPIRRWRNHLSQAQRGSKNRFHAALRKYGEAAFIYEVTDCANSQAELDSTESRRIMQAKSHDPKFGFNTRLPL